MDSSVADQVSCDLSAFVLCILSLLPFFLYPKLPVLMAKSPRADRTKGITIVSNHESHSVTETDNY